MFIKCPFDPEHRPILEAVLAAYQARPEEAVSAVRQFLWQHSKARLPGRDRILQDYDFFQRLLSDLLARAIKPCYVKANLPE